jgi:hypothetical protein
MHATKANIDSMAEEIAAMAAHIDAATQRLLTLLRQFDLCRGWFEQGAVSCAQWLSWRIGMSPATAHDRIRVAHKLAELPLIDAAFARGEISYSKVRAMVRVARGENEEVLLGMASDMTAAQLEKTCRLYRGAVRPEVSGADIEKHERWVSRRDTDDGMVAISIRLLPDEAARFLASAEHCSETGNLADGVVHMAEAALVGRTGSRPAVEAVLHIDADSLSGRTPAGDGLSAETSRRVLCDCGVVPMLEDARGDTIDVGRKRRTIPAALRRALSARDGGCVFPGCDNSRFVDGHHLVHWLDGGDTSLENTAQLCRGHHRFVHEWGFAISKTADGFVFFGPDGAPIRNTVERPAIGAIAVATTSRTHAPGWDGWPIDYALCVEALAAGATG